MHFALVDRILEMEAGRKIRVEKLLTLGEEYLADHFPTFPVMPGVLMLQTLVEAGAWLIRVSEDFQHSMIVLREVKNVKYGQFMEPGRRLEVTVELVEEQGRAATFRGRGEALGQQTVSARWSLTRYNLREQRPEWEAIDQRLVAHFRHRYTLLIGAEVGTKQPAVSGGEPRIA
jgi:3-hydroxyacyl-[acyl-carrier-protein] dehydratase